MIKHKYKKWRFLPFIFLTILCACTSEQDYTPENERKQVVALTVSSAKALYEQYIGTTSRLKSTADERIELLPDWSSGQLFSDSNWYVVESPLEVNDGALRFMTDQVREYSEANNVLAKQVFRQVVMRNKQTGLDYAFMMVIIPDLDYMLRKGDELSENQYLTRSDDFSGQVFYYEVDGSFVNGWKYQDGKISGALLPDANGSLPKLKSYETVETWSECVGFTVFYKSGYSESGILCYTVIAEIEVICSEPGYEGGGFDFSGGGGGLDSSPSPSPTDKEPDKRTDCSGRATTNANNAQSAMKVPDVLVNLNILREYAKGKDNEWSMLINSYYGSYAASELKELGGSFGTLYPNANTVYDVHTHSDDKREGHSVLTGLSAGDVYGMFNTSSSFPNFKGFIVIAYDGSEYLLAVDDREKLQNFWGVEANKELFKSGDNTIFKNKDMEKEYRDIREKLEEKEYSTDDAHDYALSYLLDKYNTGLKISKKTDKNTDFKETKTTQDTKTNEYKPSICP